MEVDIDDEKQKKEDKRDSFQEIFLILNLFEEPKEKKNWFPSLFHNYVSTIKQGVENMNRDQRYDRLRKRMMLNSLSRNKKKFSPNFKKSNLRIGKGSNLTKYYLNKYNSNKKMNRLIMKSNNDSEDLSKNNSSININDNKKIKNKIINTTNSVYKYNSNDYIVKAKSQDRNKFILNLNMNSTTLPSIQGVGNKNKYLKTNINEISETSDLLEKKLIQQEKKKYIKFKTKYNRLITESKKNQININQYINPKDENKFKLSSNSGADEATIINLKKVMRQITNKLKNKYDDKPSIPDIIDEVEKFKYKEKILRERTKKNHERFDYLINDSNIIQKRIDIKCRKTDDI
jgi:hypothetical protein